jgi:hypothetical protein
MCHGDDLHRWWVTCPSDSDGVTRIIERRGPADEHDKHAKLAKDCLIEALAERRPPCGDAGRATEFIRPWLATVGEQSAGPSGALTAYVLPGS